MSIFIQIFQPIFQFFAVHTPSSNPNLKKARKIAGNNKVHFIYSYMCVSFSDFELITEIYSLITIYYFLNVLCVVLNLSIKYTKG